MWEWCLLQHSLVCGVLTLFNWAAEMTTTGKNHIGVLGQEHSGSEAAYPF